MAKRRLIVAIAGDTGAVYGLRALEALKKLGTVEAHLIVTAAGVTALAEERVTLKDAGRLADAVHAAADRAMPAIDADGLLIAPCSVETLHAVADEDNVDAVARAAEACLTAQRRVAMLVTATPLDLATIQLMAKATRLGAVIVPPVPAFYHRPSTLEDIVDQTVGRALDLFGIDSGLVRRWTESERHAS